MCNRFQKLEITKDVFPKLQVRAGAQCCYDRGNSSLLAEIVVRRWAIRDGWQQSRKKSLLECTMRTKSEISKKRMRNLTHKEQSQTEL